MRPRAGLRRILTTVLIAQALVALGAAAALVVLTRYLHETTVTLSAAVESVGLAEEAMVDLLLHERASEPVVRRRLEADLRSQLGLAREHVASPTEAVVLAAARARPAAYLAAPDAAPPAPADAALERLVDENLAESRASAARAARWDRLADWLGLAVAALLALGLAGILYWLHGVAFRPVFALGEAMRRYGAGDRDARAPEEGPAELRAMAETFNRLASAEARARQQQLAFLSSVAHDLRNPLTSLRVSTSLVRPDRPLPDEAKIRHLFELVQRQVGRLDRMVGDLLDLSRLEAGEVELELAERDVAALATGVVDLLAASSPDHTIVIDAPDGPVRLRCDGLRFEQILTNLVANALKYSPEGGEVRVEIRDEPDAVSIAVVDQGIGIREEELARLFQPYRRLDQGRRVAGGAGLGLFFVRQLVAAHGGTLAVRSKVSEGSTFTVRFPRPRREAPAPRGPEAERAAPSPG